MWLSASISVMLMSMMLFNPGIDDESWLPAVVLLSLLHWLLLGVSVGCWDQKLLAVLLVAPHCFSFLIFTFLLPLLFTSGTGAPVPYPFLSRLSSSSSSTSSSLSMPSIIPFLSSLRFAAASAGGAKIFVVNNDFVQIVNFSQAKHACCFGANYFRPTEFLSLLQSEFFWIRAFLFV